MTFNEPCRTLADLLTAVPSEAHRTHRIADLVQRTRLVRSEGWAPFRYTWSSGEVAGVALALGDIEIVAEVLGSEKYALDTWAADLWGINGGRADSENNHQLTRGLFASVRASA